MTIESISDAINQIVVSATMAAQQAPFNVLLLEFEYTDLPGLNEEAVRVSDAFMRKGYRPDRYKIKMQNPWEGQNGLRERLDTFLKGEGNIRILYYHGHGAFSFRNGLELCR